MSDQVPPIPVERPAGRLARAVACLLSICSVTACRDRMTVDAEGAQSPIAATSRAQPSPASRAAGSRRPRTSERRRERLTMVERQLKARDIEDQAVLDAMSNVPRHWFVPQPQAARAYQDSPLPIGFRQTISQPYIVALMTECLEIKPGHKVLEIGTGSGYQAAVLAELTDRVFTIEIVEALAKRTIGIFEKRGYTSIRTRIGDGYRGWPEHAPFDAIIVTCAPNNIPRPLLDQLAPGGRLCIPVGEQFGPQALILVRKKRDGTLERRRIESVAFVPMTGEAQNRRGD